MHAAGRGFESPRLHAFRVAEKGGDEARIGPTKMKKALNVFEKTTVLSVEQATTLPFLTYRLAVDGMNVIRVENPHRPDPNRFVGDDVLGEEGMNTYFLPLNVGKKSITLNLASEEGRSLLKEVIRGLDVDVFATNQLQKGCVKAGIDYETLREVKEDIIWLGITGFGPDCSEAAYDPVLQARAGLMDLTGEPDGGPMLLGLPVADLLGGEHAYSEVMKALFRREATGEGCRIDVSMFRSIVSWLHTPLALTVTFDYRLSRSGNTHRFFAPVSVFETADGYVYIAVGSDRQWDSMTRLPGFESLRKKEYERNAGRIADVEALNRRINEITRTLTSAELVETLRKIKVPASEVKSVRDVAGDPHICGNLLRSTDPVSGLEMALPPPPVVTSYLKRRGMTVPFPPRLGEHNRRIYGDLLGRSEEELESLARKGVI